MNSHPIGIFDSGVGGLTVYKEISKILPQETLIYLGDTARVPYGTKSKETVIKYALEDSLFLLDRDVKLIVVACNTATAFGLAFLQKRLKVPVVGVIVPGARAAIAATKNKRIGIIGTEGTILSGAYQDCLKTLAGGVEIFARATPLFVPLIEEAIGEPAILKPVVSHYLSDFKKDNIDTLILGCTHYPLLKPCLVDFFTDTVTLIDSAQATADAVRRVLTEQGTLNTGERQAPDHIFVTDSPERVKRIAERFLGHDHVPIEKVDLD